MEREKGDGNTVLLTVIGVATLLVALVGATFAYFSTQIDNASQQSMTLGTAKPVGLNYAGKNIAVENVIPGDTLHNTDQGTFTVTNPAGSTVAQKYDMILKVTTNTFNDIDGADQLFLTITSDDATVAVPNAPSNVATEPNGVKINLTDGAAFTGTAPTATKTYTDDGVYAAKEYKIVNEQVIAKPNGTDVTHTYKMLLEFIDTHDTQDYNQNQNFAAHIELANVVSVNS